MTIKRVLTALLFTAVLISSGYAHDPSQHKGKPVSGKIAAVGNDGFDLLVGSQTIKVSLTSKTKIEHGKQVVSRDHLQKGSTVSVFGTKLPSGEMVAREVVIGDGGHEQHGGQRKGHVEKKKESQR